MSRGHLWLLLAALYFAQGLPYGFFTQALPVLMREAGYSLTAISAISLLFIPWAVKFLWAPWVDHRGSRRAWLLPLQVGGVLLALTQAGVSREDSYSWVQRNAMPAWRGEAAFLCLEFRLALFGLQFPAEPLVLFALALFVFLAVKYSGADDGGSDEQGGS